MYDLTAVTLCFKLEVFYINICCFTNKTKYQVLRYDTVFVANRGLAELAHSVVQPLNLWEPPHRCTKFQDYNFTRSRYISGIPKFKNRSHNLVHASTWPNFCIFGSIPSGQYLQWRIQGECGGCGRIPLSSHKKFLNDYIWGIVEKRRIRTGCRLAS